jgi:cellulose 1,4-beta-cellobiosidase
MRLRAPHWRGPRRGAPPGRTSRTRAFVTAVATFTLGAAGLAAIATAPAANAASACTASYSVTGDWGTGFQVALTVTAGSSALTGWTVTYSYAGNQTLSQGWSGTWSQSGQNVTVSNVSWNGSLAAGASTTAGGLFNYSGTNAAPTSVTCTGTTGVGSTPSTSPSSSTSPTTSPSTSPTTTATGSCGSGVSLKINPPTFSVPSGTTTDIGVSLTASPASPIAVTVAASGGGLSITSGSSITLSSSNWNLPQPVTVAAGSGTGTTTFTASATGCTSVTSTGTETGAPASGNATHVTNPFTGATWFVNPDYTAEADNSAASASGTLAAQMTYVGTQPTFIWMDHIGAIYGGSDNTTALGGAGRLSLQTELNDALAKASSGPVLFPVVIYDVPDRDCAALASNGELSIANNGLNYYEHSYIDPIAQILSGYQNTNLRIIAVIEPDSLPNLVTNTSMANCANANSSGVYVNGIEYALNKLHAMSNVYNYMDIAHSAWLGWPSNMTPAVSLYHQVAAATTAGVASVDGFVSDTANTIPVHEPYMTATQTVDGNAVDTVQYYSYDPYIDEYTYDQAMYSNLVSAGFSSNIGMLIDTSRDGWGDPATRPTGPATSYSSTADFVNKSKIDARPFRGDWCNPEDAGIGALPQANPDSSFTHLYAYVWVKPPGESDGTYPAYSGTGDPHCDPNGTQTDGSGNSYPTDAIPDSPPAGTWFPVQFNQLVSYAYPAIP